MVPVRTLAALGPAPVTLPLPPPVPPPPPAKPKLGGDSSGTGTAPLLGDPTAADPDTTDVRIDESRPEGTGAIRSTIRDAARRGFASAPYAKVYKDYAAITEDVMHAEAVPLSKRYLVKRYFWSIRPE
jgi:hypothetical protein